MEWMVRLGGNQPTLHKEFQVLSRVKDRENNDMGVEFHNLFPSKIYSISSGAPYRIKLKTSRLAAAHLS